MDRQWIFGLVLFLLGLAAGIVLMLCLGAIRL
jgi:hypothetical protein